LIITDVTAMRGDNVCIAGYDSSMTCIRPVLHMGQVQKSFLFRNRQLIVYPSTKISFDLIRPISMPPHTEDFIFEEGSIRFEGRITEREWKDLLHRTSYQTFSELFPLLDERSVLPGSAGPSLGTMIPADVPVLSCDYYREPPRLRMKILDREGVIKERVPITDLAFRKLFEVILQDYRNDCEKTVQKLNNTLKGREIYLRFGLSRPFAGSSDPTREVCWLQINGIHTFPNLYDYDYSRWIALE